MFLFGHLSVMRSVRLRIRVPQCSALHLSRSACSALDFVYTSTPSFRASECPSVSLSLSPPVSSLQYQFANFENDGYNKTGKGYLKLQLINQREDFSFALFSGGLSKVILKEKKDSTF